MGLYCILYFTGYTVVLQVRSRIQTQENALTVRLAARPALLVNLTVLSLTGFIYFYLLKQHYLN